MTDLVLTEDHKQYQDLARDFSSNEIAPAAAAFDHSRQFPADICKKAWEIGLFNMRLPESLGGLGLSTWDACVIAEELGAGCVGISSVIFGTDLAVAPLIVAGSKEQQERWLKPMMETFTVAAYCFEDHSGMYKVTYKRNGDQFILNGNSASLNAGHAAWITVSARDIDNASEQTLFVLPTDTKGFTPGDQMNAVGMKAADMRICSFNNITLTSEHVIGTAGNGSDIVALSDASMSTIVACYAVGLMRSALENAIKYSKERHTFGRPIANHQAVGFMLSDIAKDTEAARLTAWKAAWLVDQGHPNLLLSRVSRTLAVESSIKAGIDAVQVYGGYGYSREYPVEKLMRDAKALQIVTGSGTNARVQYGEALLSGATAGAW